MPITREIFDEQRRPRFGSSNPERMRLAFWEWMIRGEMSSNDDGLMMQDGVVRSGYRPSRARDFFQVPLNCADGPIWTFDRMGATITELPDGRTICIGGEHEDFYDSDFCIYNDVVVFGPAEQIEIYGYSKEVFPPTDFHSATLLDNRIIVIGGLGYMDQRRPGFTPVYALDLPEYRFSRVETTGEAPGWLFRHEALTTPDGTITIRGGETIDRQNNEERTRRNIEEFALDTRSGVWRQLTRRNWRQYRIHQEDHQWFVLEAHPAMETLFPVRIEHTPQSSEELNQIRFTVRGVPVTVTSSVSEIEVLVEGELPGELCDDIVEEVRTNTETAISRKCVVERV
jgi:hypothetical protein